MLVTGPGAPWLRDEVLIRLFTLDVEIDSLMVLGAFLETLSLSQRATHNSSRSKATYIIAYKTWAWQQNDRPTNRDVAASKKRESRPQTFCSARPEKLDKNYSPWSWFFRDSDAGKWMTILLLLYAVKKQKKKARNFPFSSQSPPVLGWLELCILGKRDQNGLESVGRIRTSR